MTRGDAERLAHKFVTLQLAYKDNPRLLKSIRMVAIIMASDIGEGGRMDPSEWLRRCGIYRKKAPKGSLLDLYLEGETQQ